MQMVIYSPPRLCSTHSHCSGPLLCCFCCFRETKAETNVSVLPALCECVFHESLGCGSLSSPAAAVTRYSTHTFLLLIQACLRAMILVQFNLLQNTALLKRRTCNQQLMNTVPHILKNGYMLFNVDLWQYTLI